MKPRVFTNIPAANLPGKGLAQHSMLYIGEGYNKMFIVHEGKVIWTYSTGSGNEYDDVWMLSNGNILFTRKEDERLRVVRRNVADRRPKDCLGIFVGADHRPKDAPGRADRIDGGISRHLEIIAAARAMRHWNPSLSDFPAS